MAMNVALVLLSQGKTSFRLAVCHHRCANATSNNVTMLLFDFQVQVLCWAPWFQRNISLNNNATTSVIYTKYTFRYPYFQAIIM